MRFIFRKYRKADREKILNILIDKRHLNKYTLKTLQYKIASFLGIYRSYVYLIEEKDDGEIIGIGILINKVDHGLHQREWWIEGVRIADKHKRSGVGTLLMKNLIYQAEKKGAKKIFLNIESNNLPAYQFFSKLDFKPVARIFTFIIPFLVSANNFPSDFENLIPAKLEIQSKILQQVIFPIGDSYSDKLIEFYRKFFTLLRVLINKREEIATTTTAVLVLTHIYYFFKIRVKIISPAPIASSELEKMILYQFSRFVFIRFREIIIEVISLVRNQEELSLTLRLLKASSIEDLMVFETPNLKDTR
ncbi:MAG: GNAT family N-acetyltransferase [Desulfobacterota bacterium]|nr:GNAT family N-acetyltransferase [Thermodesulfobacteriota bacterium]